MAVLNQIYLVCLVVAMLAVGAINAQSWTTTKKPYTDYPTAGWGMASHGNTLGGHVMYTTLILVPVLHVLLRKLNIV